MSDEREDMLLFGGYIRENYGNHLTFPLCLSGLCLRFFKPFIHWRVIKNNNKNNKNNKNKKMRDKINSKLFNINGFIFLLQIDGERFNIIEQEIKKQENRNKYNIIIYYEIYCKQIKWTQKGSTFKNNLFFSVWSKSVLLNQNMSQFINNNNNNNKCLDFFVHLEILKHPTLKIDGLSFPINPIKIKKIIKYKWQCNKSLNDISINSISPHYSPNFNIGGNFCCYFYEQRLFHSNAIKFGLKLLKINCNIKRMQIDCVINMHCNDNININDHKGIQFTDYKNDHQWLIYKNKINSIHKIRTINIQIQINKIYGNDLSSPTTLHLIPKRNWIQYNIYS